MSKGYTFHLEYIPLLLEQIEANADRISKLIAEAESGETIEMVKREVEKLTARNESLLHLVANMIEEIKRCPPDTVPPIRPVFF